MSQFQSYVLIAATLVSVVSFVMFIVSWNRRNARIEKERREIAIARAEAQTRERLARTQAIHRETSSTFAGRLSESRQASGRVADPYPVAPSGISLKKSETTPAPSSEGYRKPTRKPVKRGGGRGRRSGSSSGSSYGGYDASSCSSSGGSSCCGGGSSCGGGGGD